MDTNPSSGPVSNDAGSANMGLETPKEQDLPIEGPKPVNPNKNNPLGQRQPEQRIGQSMEHLKHGQSAELVNEVRKNAPKRRRRPVYTQDNEEENPK